ncbi:MAG: HepT-like ribonuclease domain-containing protein [Vicinamibacteria bacterium]
MKAIDPELMKERSQVLEKHLRRIEEALPKDGAEFQPGTDAADAVALHLLFGVQIVLDLSIFACIHFGLQAPASYDDAIARLAHDGQIGEQLSQRLERVATFRDAFVHAYDDLDPGSIHRAAKVLPEDLRAFMVDISDQLAR